MFDNLPPQMYLNDNNPTPPAIHTLEDFQAAQAAQQEYGYRMTRAIISELMDSEDTTISRQALAIWKEGIDYERVYIRPDILVAALQATIADHIENFIEELKETVDADTPESRNFDRWLKYRVRRASRP